MWRARWRPGRPRPVLRRRVSSSSLPTLRWCGAVADVERGAEYDGLRLVRCLVGLGALDTVEEQLRGGAAELVDRLGDGRQPWRRVRREVDAVEADDGHVAWYTDACFGEPAEQ